MATLCFGGSFNPVHNAHLTCCHAAAKAAGFDRVMLIPAHQPVLKSKSYDLASPEHRIAMLLLAAESMDGRGIGFDIDPLELERDGPTYTIDTVEVLRARDEHKMNWLIGADQLLNLHHWHRFESLMRLTQFWVMERPGYPIDWEAVDPRARNLRDHVVAAPLIDISATDIRGRLREGKTIEGLVPPKVREYILKHQLYIP